MPWYKFEARHGGGHMACDVEYKWYDEKLTKSGDEWEDWVRHGDFHDAVGEVKIVKDLPSKVREAKISRCLEDIQSASDMITRLCKMR